MIGMATVPLDSLTHQPGTGGPLADTLVVAVAVVPITALLGGVFAGVILLADGVMPVKGSVAVAVATLVIAALFNPLRKRVQRTVDRRFNRSRYDVEAVVAAFTARLRHTVDLDVIRHDLVGVTHEAFQPAHVSMWLAPAPARSPVLAEVVEAPGVQTGPREAGPRG
jgi:hypothetical protein